MADLDRKHPGDTTRRFIGNEGWVGALALQMIGPDVRSGCRIHQLKVYFQLGVIALNVTDDRVLHAEVCLQTATSV